MKRSLSSAQFLAATFFGLIAVGTLLLWLPAAAARGHSIGFLDALFTSTSAVCVTGLIVRDTPVDFSAFGQVVVLLLIQAGGLGYMTLSTTVAVAFGRKLSLQERVTLQEALNVDTRQDLVRFALVVFKTTLALELLGALVLTVRWWSELGPARAAWYGLFHAVSAFNNAGFALFSDNLASFKGDASVSLVISALIIAGGIGFLTIRELVVHRSWRKLSLHSKLALLITGFLIVGGTLTFLAFEWSNEKTLGPSPFGTKLLAAYFHSVSTRTAGFNTIDIGALTAPSLLCTLALMFIGASPGGTGGGVKTTTFGVTVLALWATVRGDREPVIFKRRIGLDVISKAFFICLMGFLLLNGAALGLLLLEGRALIPSLFETTSAFGTVGLSMGSAGSPLSLSGHFSVFGKLLMVVMMFIGRVGPLTVAVALAARRDQARLRYPEGRVMIG